MHNTKNKVHNSSCLQRLEKTWKRLLSVEEIHCDVNVNLSCVPIFVFVISVPLCFPGLAQFQWRGHDTDKNVNTVYRKYAWLMFAILFMYQHDKSEVVQVIR